MTTPGFTERENFAGADLRGADLTDAEFTYVSTHSADYGRTDVSGAEWQNACLKRVTTDRVIGWPAA
jgi:uncharacterized protein YjbI with pentapeptide repeats